MSIGQLVGIVSGTHEGLYARVIGSEDDDVGMCFYFLVLYLFVVFTYLLIEVVRLESSSEDVAVPKSDVSIVDLSQLSKGHPALKFMAPLPLLLHPSSLLPLSPSTPLPLFLPLSPPLSPPSLSSPTSSFNEKNTD
jgi:hypothetical protein